MRRSTLLISVSLFGISLCQNTGLKSQTPIILTQSDMAVPGDKFIDVNDSTPTAILLPVPAGANVTWNYATLGTTTVDTIKCELPGATPYGGFYPSTNIALSFSMPGLEYSFMNSSSGQLGLYGEVTKILTSNVAIQYKPNADTLNVFPETYKSHWKGGYSYRIQYPDTGSRFDSVRVLDFTQYHDTVVAWGMLTTPYKTDSVILKLTVTRSIDSIFLRSDSTGKWRASGTHVSGDSLYDWIANGLHYAMLSAEVQKGKIIVANWLKGDTILGINQITDKAGSLVYPNPANNVLNIKLASCETGTVKVIDITGREISSSQFSNKQAQINTSCFSNGIYFYQVFDRSGNWVDTGKFSVVK